MKPSDVRITLDPDGSYLFTLPLPDGRVLTDRLKARYTVPLLRHGLFNEIAREIRSQLVVEALHLLAHPPQSIDLTPTGPAYSFFVTSQHPLNSHTTRSDSPSPTSKLGL